MKSHGALEFSRRSLMKAAGSTLFVPLFLKQAFAQAAVVRPNLVLLMQTNGCNQPSFWPTGASFDSPILNKLLTDTVVGPKTTLIKNLNLKKIGNPAGNGHDWGWHSLYSGYDNITKGSDQFGGGPSIDQDLIKKLTFATPFKNIHCGVHAADYRLINAGRISFSCAAAGSQVPCELNVYSLYTKVFGSLMPTGGSDPAATQAAMRRLAQRKSVLDAVVGDLTALKGRVGAKERIKIDAHLTAVNDFEARLAKTVTPPPTTTPAACATAKPSKTGVPTTGQGNEVNADALMRLFMEFIAAVVGCNMAGIVTFQFGRGGEHFHYNWLNIPGMRADFHDEIAHKDNGSDATAASVMVAVGKYYTELVTDLGKRLAAFPQADGKTALDNALVVWGNEIATGPHGINGLPIVLVGGAAGKLKRTGYVVNANGQAHHKLGCSLHNIMGNPAKGFGAQPDCGALTGLDLA
jgi:hypothetical protein